MMTDHSGKFAPREINQANYSDWMNEANIVALNNLTGSVLYRLLLLLFNRLLLLLFNRLFNEVVKI